MDTPKVGDIVRVVIEGKVSHAGATLLEVDGIHTVDPLNKLVKSIEILTPAKPSVADLPAWAIVKIKETGEILQRTAATDRWEIVAGSAGHVNSRSLDGVNWIQMVEKSDG
jgi:hypothetical protein